MKTQTSCLDDETLAAFIDGRLEERQRRSVVEHLAECEECYDLMAGSLRLHQALEDETQQNRPALTLVPGPDGPESMAESGERGAAETASRGRASASDRKEEPLPAADSGSESEARRPKSQGRSTAEPEGSPERGSRFSGEAPEGGGWWGWRPLAAALAVLGLGTALLWPLLRPQSLARSLDGVELSEGWSEHTWYGLDRVEGLPEEEEQAFRGGVHHLDLNVALLHGQRAAASEAIKGLLETQSDTLLQDYFYESLLDELEAGTSLRKVRSQVRQAEDIYRQALELREVLDFYRFGGWVEGTRLAATTREASYFESKPFEGEAGYLLESSSLRPPVKDVVRKILGLAKPPIHTERHEELLQWAGAVLQRSGRPPFRIEDEEIDD